MAQYVLGEAGAKKFKQLEVSPIVQSRRATLESRHAIDNLYPKPYEVRWSSSCISGGGYMIWLPDDCLWLNGINEAPSAWTGPTGESLRDNRVFQDSHWYNLTKILDIDPELSSFSVFLRPSVGLVPLLDLEDKSTLYSIDSYVRIADVESKRAKQNVNSNLTLNAKESPFELFKVPDDQRPSGSLPQAKVWSMRNQLFQANGKLHSLPNCLIPAPTSIEELSNRYVRLVRLEDDTWCIDMVKASNREDIEAAGSLTVGEVLTYGVDPGEMKAKSVHPLWFLGSLNQKAVDVREAWYMVDSVETDARSISLVDDILSTSVPELSTKLHFRHFHDDANDLSVSTLIDGTQSSGTTWIADNIDFVMRDKKGRAPDDGSSSDLTSQVMYLPMQQLIDQFKKDWDGGGGEEGEISADQLSSIPSPGMFAWTESTRTIGVGGCMVCRQWVSCTSGIGSGKADGLYQLQVTIGSSGSINLTVVSNASLGQGPTTTQSWIPIYQISGGKIVADYRGAFVVPTYE